MKCTRCGSELPSVGAVCKVCGMSMNKDQLTYQNKMKDRNSERIVLLIEKYGQENKIEYRENKENKILGIIIITVILLILIIITILVNVN